MERLSGRIAVNQKPEELDDDDDNDIVEEI